MIKLHL